MRPYHTLILCLLCVVGLSVSLIYDVFYISKPDFDHNIENKIVNISGGVEDIAHRWLTTTDTSYIAQCWERGVDDAMQHSNVSLYLFDNDSLLFWANHLYPKDIDSIFTKTSGVQTWGPYESLVHNQEKGSRRAVVIINLRLRGNVSSEVFNRGDVEIVFDLSCITPDKALNMQSVNLPYCTFKVVMPAKEPLIWINFVGWLGFFAGMLAIGRWFSRRVTPKNALQKVALFALIVAGLRIFVYFVDIPHGGSYSFTSLGSMLVSQLFILIIIELAYRLRFKIRTQIEAMSTVKRYAMLIGFTLFINAAIVYFHYAMVQTIYTYAGSVELYNILAIKADTLFFYLIGAVFVALRILYGRFFTLTLRSISPYIRLAISVVILIAMVAPIESYIGGTGYILVMVHIGLVSINCLSCKNNFAYNILIFSAYITMFSAIESSNARGIAAERYAAEISTNEPTKNTLNTNNIFDPSSRLTYTIITENEIKLKAGNKFNAQVLLPYINVTKDTIINIGNTTHNIKQSRVDNSIVVVSYDKTTVLDIISLFSYLFIWLFVLSGLLLEFSKVNIFKHYNIHSMLYRIRLIIFGVVIISLGVVCFVVYQYSGDSYRGQQRQLLNNSVQSLIRSFNSFNCPGDANQVMLTWYTTRGTILGYVVNIYDIKGIRIGGSDEHYSASRLYDKAYRQLAVMGQPYFDRFDTKNDIQIMVAYTPLSKNEHRLGFMSVVILNHDSVVSRYSLLGNIFNIFIVIFLLAVVLSMGLYNIISKPLMVISNAMEGIGKLQKIPLTKDIKINNEVGALINQYNNMIDYLNESYTALARAEREGAWKEMARQVAHEIKNPLTPMRLKIQMLQRMRNNAADMDAKQLDSTLEVLLTQIDILNRIASEFSDLARMPQGTTVRLDLCELVRNTITLYSSNDCAKIYFEPQTLCGVFVEAEYAGLTRVFVNLLQNATQAIEGYGTIVVRLWVEGCIVVVEIEDSGKGIPSDMMERIFEPNFTTKSTGSGLGLALSRQIIESAGGKISAFNSSDGGAIFRIELMVNE